MIYRFQVLKQADVVLALFLQGDEFTDRGEAPRLRVLRRADDRRLDPVGAWCSRSSRPRSGTTSSPCSYFLSALFVDLADLHRNTSDGVHVASTGGVWSALVYGFGGMRDYLGTITFDPRLPAGWERV